MKWFKRSWKYIVGGIIFYAIHLSVEAFIVNNVLALAGLKLPVLVG